MRTNSNRALLVVAIALLLLPVLYVGSYLALVKPGSGLILVPGGYHPVPAEKHYRCELHALPIFFWPLEQMDRKVRPLAWCELAN